MIGQVVYEESHARIYDEIYELDAKLHDAETMELEGFDNGMIGQLISLAVGGLVLFLIAYIIVVITQNSAFNLTELDTTKTNVLATVNDPISLLPVAGILVVAIGIIALVLRLVGGFTA